MARTPKNVGTSYHVQGLNELLKLLSKLPKELQNNVRDASSAIASDLLSGARNAAHTRQQNLAAQAMKVKRDRVPTLRVGRAKVRRDIRGTDIFYGAEFGGGRRPTTQQFPDHRGKRGYFLYPTAQNRGRTYGEMWIAAVDKAFEDWNYRPPGTL